MKALQSRKEYMSAPKLYLLTSNDDIRTLSDKLERAFDTGVVSLLQIRRHHTLYAVDLITLYRETEILISLADRYNIPAVVNENLELASHFNVGIHLSSTTNVRVVREILGDELHVGASCHGDIALFKEAKKSGASYGAMGAMFGTMSRPLAKTIDGEILARATCTKLPLCLIGGIALSNLDTLRKIVGDAPIDYLAVTTDILHHGPESVGEKCRAWRDYLENW